MKKKILVACGTGIATSTAVNSKVQRALDENGYKGKYEINQIKVTDAARLSKDYDLLISTTQEPPNLECEYMSAVPFLTGMKMNESIERLLEVMKK